jgi:hypothetical protein
LSLPEIAPPSIIPVGVILWSLLSLDSLPLPVRAVFGSHFTSLPLKAPSSINDRRRSGWRKKNDATRHNFRNATIIVAFVLQMLVVAGGDTGKGEGD